MHVFASVHCCLVVACWGRAGWPIDSCLWCLVVFLSLWCPGSGVVLGCIDLYLCHLSYFGIPMSIHLICVLVIKFIYGSVLVLVITDSVQSQCIQHLP